MVETLTHFIGGTKVAGDPSGESINPSDLDETVARYPKGGARRSTRRPRRRAMLFPPGPRRRRRFAPTCSTAPGRW